MVFLLVLATVIIFLAVDYLLKKEGREIKEIGRKKSTPIFLTPEKALRPVNEGAQRLYHMSHSWVQPLEENYVYVGFDDFISTLFSVDVKIKDLPLVGSHVPQGAKIWDVGMEKHRITQLAPVSGEVVNINPACKMNIPLPSTDVEKSWIIKLKTNELDRESNNLMKQTQAAILNNALSDELYLAAQQGHYMNDGGQIEPGYLEKMSEKDWRALINLFFPYHENVQ